MDTKSAALGFAAVGSQHRLLIMTSLVKAGRGGLSVGEIQNRTKIAASTLAHHLKCLTEAGLVRQERIGRSTICRADFDFVEALAGYLLEECCAEEKVAS